jgi:pimeloyl-ACP methyl ester carboxylesterase
MLGEATDRAAAAISDARIHVLDGHGHLAHKTDPDLVAATIRQFIGAGDNQRCPPARH